MRVVVFLTVIILIVITLFHNVIHLHWPKAYYSTTRIPKSRNRQHRVDNPLYPMSSSTHRPYYSWYTLASLSSPEPATMARTDLPLQPNVDPLEVRGHSR
ncbi:hypothetical protein NXS19_010806 [Fusarium pseudograminearum]|nr:hypothetical protein NXS19_010806 [Fusarium pseudograminearum]